MRKLGASIMLPPSTKTRGEYNRSRGQTTACGRLSLQEETIMPNTMPKTRRTLFYLASYLLITGLALLFFPDLFLKLAFATREYPGAFVRFSGILMIGLATVVVNIIRFGNKDFYRATLIARVPMWIATLGLYFYTQETFFIVVLAVLGTGIVLTSSAYLSERNIATQPTSKL